MDMNEIVKRSVVRYICVGYIFMLSGSYREGFWFKFLDLDLMCWWINNKVIFDLFDLNIFNVLDLEIIFMEYMEIFLGFVRLKLLILLKCILILCVIVLYR